MSRSWVSTEARLGRTILVVDDSPAVCEAARQILQPAGYDVLWVSDGYAAVETCRRHAGPIDLLLTDVIMPGMDGRELAQHVATSCPNTRILFMSGAVSLPDLQCGNSFLPKPYGPVELLEKVEEALFW
jgi:two-component system, cell cycle sensor histidine kinase and response regulator CckA